MSDKAGHHPPLDPPGVDRDGAPGEVAPDVELGASLTATAASTDPEAVFEAARRIEADPALSPAGALGADALSSPGAGAAGKGSLLLYLGVLVALALLAAALWAAVR